MIAKRISVEGPCWGYASGDFGEDDCHCPEYDNADPDVVGYPPFHEGCVCLVKTKEIHFLDKVCDNCGHRIPMEIDLSSYTKKEKEHIKSLKAVGHTHGCLECGKGYYKFSKKELKGGG